ncbi:MAG TPA: site-2 protease family protein [Chthoniobacteraceae bacterium]|nr:site-2 protease family protein [Chthoniobacteraceae bacterium]
MNQQTFRQRVKQLFAPVLVALAAAGKFLLPALKFGWPMLKVGGTMLISMWFYAKFYGWPFALGFVVLIFIHEMGHLIAARIMGLKVGAPMFIPFLGAMIMLKEVPANAWVESVVGIGGPLLGSLGALGAAALYPVTHNALFLVLGYTGFFLNLFNLVPIVPLDGGRIVSAISPWLWVPGLLILVGFLLTNFSDVSFIILFIVLLSLPRVLALFRPKTASHARYFECTPAQRWIMGILYFSLTASLYLGMTALRQKMGR